MLKPLLLILTVATILPIAHTANAHIGRRFIIEIADNQLQAQGVNTGNSDGAPPIREYVNAIHDHWKNVPPEGPRGPIATSFLPDFEAPIDISFSRLKDHELGLTLVSATQWKDAPPMMPPPGTVPQLVPLDPGVTIKVESDGGVVDSDSLGYLQLSASVPQGGIQDIVTNYEVNGHPTDTIHVLEFILSATPPATFTGTPIADSDPIYILLSPDGPNAMAKRHHASLYLERYLATRVPEPAALAVLWGLAPWVLRRRRQVALAGHRAHRTWSQVFPA